MSDSFDLVVIGAGPGGYVCAIRAAQLGLSVAIIERRAAEAKTGPSLGGTCLNVGCIPSKALLDSSEHYHNATTAFATHGITFDGKPGIDVSKMMKRKEKVVKELTGGISYLMKKNGITVVAGSGTLVDKTTVQVNAPDGSQKRLTAKNIVLAMGSTPVELPFMPFDGTNIVSSDQAIAFDKVPEELVVVGGGVIGLELGSVWARLGTQVTVIEFLDRLVPGFDLDAAKALQKSLGKLGISFYLSTKVTGAEVKGGKVAVTAEDKAGKKLNITADKVLVAVGRRGVTEDCGLEAVGVQVDKGKIVVDENLQTTVPGVYAIGDLIHGPMLAHKAEEDGVAAAETIAGKHGHVDYRLVPGVVYTWPELASIGIGEDEAKESGRKVKVGTFQFMANGRAKASGDVDGFAKVIADEETDELLGVTILGARASDLIGEATAVMAFGGSAEDIALICHAHPTFSETVKEAALDSQGRVIHS